MGVEHAIGLASDGRIHHVRNRNSARAFFLGFALRGCSVRSLARLGDDDCELSAADQRIAILELAGVIHFHRQLDQFLEHVLPGHSSMAACPRSYNVYSSQRAQFFRWNSYFISDPYLRIFQRNTRADRVLQSFWLLENLFEHVVRETIFVRHGSPYLLLLNHYALDDCGPNLTVRR